MTPDETRILALRATAEQAGYDAVVEIPDDSSPRSVDVRVTVGGEVAAAIRVYLDGGEWRYEISARRGGVADGGLRTRHLAPADEPVTPQTLRSALGHYFARVTSAHPPAPYPPRVPEDVPAWMRVYAAT
ncbi:hypothetical protein AB0I72_00400 [Nocardiopsis sp. NPDC049922]|uniref:hypothetical protein n=1 Tax=Nocardiopsis sp. NPDC049922 TaxID=3155157 RepID=UPI0033F77FBF